MPARMKQALSSASGRSVEVRMQTAGKGCPTLVKKARFLGQRAGVGHDAEGVHLQAVVIMEAQRLMLDDPLIQREAALLQPLAAARMAGVKNRHIVFFGHLVDGSERAR